MTCRIDKTTPFWDVSRTDEERIAWLLDALTMDEKLSLIAGGGRADLPRLGIPGVGVGGEAAHGVQARNDQGPVEMRRPPEPTTSFPQPIGMSATWDPELLRQAGMVTGVEARVLHHRHFGRGLCRWAPTVDLERDPRWGRNEEGYGEDPFLTGEMASGFVQGMRGDDPYYIRVAATLKHFYANNTERGRVWKNASITLRDQYESYLEPFRRVIEKGGAEAIMTAYNRINGVQGILNHEVRDILKKQYGLTHAVGDGGAMGLVVTHAHAYGMHAETVANAIKAGVDSMSDNPALVYPAAKEAYELGLLTEAEVDEAIRNVLRTKLRLGVYDVQQRNPFDRVTEADLGCEKHQAICRQVSREAVVLLKNEEMLPLDKTVQAEDIALIGPLADAWHQDWYGGEPTFRTTLKQGFAQLLGEVACCDGHDRVTFALNGKPLHLDAEGHVCLGGEPEVFIKEDWGEGSYNFRATSTGLYLAMDPEAVKEDTAPIKAANKAVFSWHIEELFRVLPQEDGTVVLHNRFDMPVGMDENDRLITGEGVEPAALTMQVVERGEDAAVKLAAEKKIVILALGCQPMVNAKEEHDRETIVLPPYQQRLMDAVVAANANTAMALFSNYPYAFHTDARAVVWSATGAQDMGMAMAETLLGHNAPAGRLNMTWYQSDDQLPDMDDYDIIKGKRTYRYFDGQVQYPFGYGLTYTSFTYSDLAVEMEDQTTLRVSFDVTNTGAATSDEVAQVYATAPASRMKKPLKQLVGFRRLKAIAPGEKRHVEIAVPVQELRCYDVISRKLLVEAGCYTLAVGCSSAELPLAAQVEVPGESIGQRDLRQRTPAECFDDYEHMQLTQGQYGFTAVETIPGQETLLRYGDVAASTLTGRMILHLCSAQGCRAEVLVNGQLAGAWQGSTVDYNPVPFTLQDNKNRADEPARIALQQPIYANVEIPLALGELPEAVDVAVKLTGDARLCWLRCVDE